MGQAHSIEVFAMDEVSGFQIPDSRFPILASPRSRLQNAGPLSVDFI